jgi:hypothetical protein
MAAQFAGYRAGPVGGSDDRSWFSIGTLELAASALRAPTILLD